MYVIIGNYYEFANVHSCGYRKLTFESLEKKKFIDQGLYYIIIDQRVRVLRTRKIYAHARV